MRLKLFNIYIHFFSKCNAPHLYVCAICPDVYIYVYMYMLYISLVGMCYEMSPECDAVDADVVALGASCCCCCRTVAMPNAA